jgi:AcrR family transcriptional regulator
MGGRTVDWVALRTPREGLRERKKRQMRQQLTETATGMFVERGFEAVRVSEIAAACGVSEKTVFNYFPTKESLVLDHPETTMSALRAGLADARVAPVDAALRILAGELGAWVRWLDSQPDKAGAASRFRRFGELIQSTPALRAHQRDMLERLIAVAAEVLAERSGMDVTDPEPRIVATCLLGLWQVQFTGMGRYVDGVRTAAQVRQAVTADVRRAARLIDSGLATFAACGPLSRPGRPVSGR